MRRKTISLFLVIVIIILNGISGSAVSLRSEDNTPSEREYSYNDILAGVISPYDYYDKIDSSDVPYAVGYETAIGRTHIERLYDEEEHLYDVAFLNADHTKTVYYFDYPVKYIDRNGKFKDISLEIETSERDEFAYKSKDSRAESKFPHSLTDGITLDSDNISVTMIPIVNDNDRYEPSESNDVYAERLSSKSIAYKKDDKTSYEYSLTYAGFKEDIVVKEYTGQTEYSFLLRTNGLKVKEIQGSYFIVDNYDNIKATIGDIIIITADEKNNALGKLTCETIRDNYEYLLTICIENEYLIDEKTIYPIRIDPTIEIKYESNGDGAIEDVTINSLDTSAGSSGSLFVGLRNTYGISRILMRFPQLNLNSINASEDIITATVEMKDLLCETDDMYVDCHPFTGNFWTESNVDWSTVSPNSYGNRIAHVSVSYSNGNSLTPKHRYSFDITAIVKGWKLGNYDKTRGIIFKAPNNVEAGPTKINKTFASYNRATNKPTLTITYENDNYSLFDEEICYINNEYCGKYLKYNFQSPNSYASVVSGLLSSLGSNIKWRIIRVDGGYVIRSTNNSSKYLAVSEDDYSSSVEIVYVSNTSIPERCVWDIYGARNGALYIRSNYNSNFLYSYGSTLATISYVGLVGTSQYSSRIWRIVDKDYYGNSTSHTKRELQDGFSIDDFIVNINENKTPSITANPTNALWSSPSDFLYTYYSGSNGIVSNDYTNGVLTGQHSGIAIFQATHKVTNRIYNFTIYVDRYTYELVNSMGFEQDVSILIRDLYNRVDNLFYNETDNIRAWKCARVLSEFYYDGSVLNINKWNDVAGSVTENENREQYFINTLGYTAQEYSLLNEKLFAQHRDALTNGVIDFCHLQYSLAARLAYLLDYDSSLSNWGTGFITGNVGYYSDEEISYFAGWLGDAVLTGESGNTTSFKNDDYMSDLDAENLYRLITQGSSSTQAFSSYYASLASGSNRSTIFKTYISYDTVQNKVFVELIDAQIHYLMSYYSNQGNIIMVQYYNNLLNDEEYHWNTINTQYHDTYNFLKSLNDNLSNMSNYQ